MKSILFQNYFQHLLILTTPVMSRITNTFLQRLQNCLIIPNKKEAKLILLRSQNPLF